MSRIVDFHSHILPEIDDGSKSPEESVAMLALEKAQGVSRVVLTPHFYPQHDQLDRFLQRRDQAVKILRESMDGKPELPSVSVGAEVHYFQGIGDCNELSLLTIAGGNYIMVEMPQVVWTEEMYCQLEKICTKQNLQPIIAHVDRYLGGFRPSRLFRRLEGLPVLFQANAEFFLDKRTEKAALRMLREEKIHLLGSDCHNLTSRKPNLEEALKKIEKHLGEDAVARINRYEQAVLGD